MNLKYGNIVKLKHSNEELLVIGPVSLLKSISTEKEMFGISEDFPKEIVFFDMDEVDYIDSWDEEDFFYNEPIFPEILHLGDNVILSSGVIGKIIAISPVVFPVQYEIVFLVKTKNDKLLILKNDEIVKLALPEQ